MVTTGGRATGEVVAVADRTESRVQRLRHLINRYLAHGGEGDVRDGPWGGDPDGGELRLVGALRDVLPYLPDAALGVVETRLDAARSEGAGRPAVVCLCGSMRFFPLILQVAADETRNGAVVLAPFAVIPPGEQQDGEGTKARLDELHLYKIFLSDVVVVVTDESGYWGPSVRREIAYAHRRGIPVEIRKVPASAEVPSVGGAR